LCYYEPNGIFSGDDSGDGGSRDKSLYKRRTEHPGSRNAQASVTLTIGTGRLKGAHTPTPTPTPTPFPGQKFFSTITRPFLDRFQPDNLQKK